MTNKNSAFLMAVLLFGGAPSVSGCGHEKAGDAEVGEGRLALVLGGGAVLDAVSYTVTGPGGFSRAGSLDVSHSSTIAALLPLPAGGPYAITLGGTTTGESTTCGGMATFSVTAHVTTPVTVNMTCHEATRTGSVLVTGAINICPVVDGVSASPSEVVVGSAVMLGALAHDSDALPAALGYSWSAPSGTFSPGATTQSPTFTCTQAGPVTISLTVSDGDATPGCADTQSITVTCSP